MEVKQLELHMHGSAYCLTIRHGVMNCILYPQSLDHLENQLQASFYEYTYFN